MHAVIRKRQGIPWEPEQSKGLAANARFISKVGAIGNFPPADAAKLTNAYGIRAHPKLVRCILGTEASGSELRDEYVKMMLRKQAIAESRDMMKGAANLSALLSAGVVPALNSVCYVAAEPEAAVRVAALDALQRLAREQQGREYMLAQDSLAALNAAALDEVREVRTACLLAVGELARHRECATPLASAGFVQMAVDRCVSAPDGGAPSAAVQALALQVLGRVSQSPEGLAEAIKVGAVATISRLLDSPDREVRVHAAFCLGPLTIGQKEKAVALKEGVVRKCVGMLQVDDEEQQTGAALTLMSMCNGTRDGDENACKAEAVKEKVVQALAPLLARGIALEARGELNHATASLTVYVRAEEEQNIERRRAASPYFIALPYMLTCPRARTALSQATKALASVSDHPQARKVAAKLCLRELQKLSQASEPLVVKNALIAIERITWTA